MSKQVLVMGGSYFIGKRVVEALLAQDYAVFTLNRGTRPTADARVTNLVCDRNDAEQIRTALNGYTFDFVVDISGLSAQQANILCDALRMDKLQRMVFLSSSSVYDVEHLSIPYKETDPLAENRYWTDYGANKIEAEQAYINRFAETAAKVICLRPPYVYGPDNYAQRESFVFEHLTNGRPILIPHADTKLQFIAASDLAAIVTAMLTAPLEAVSIFNVGNRQAVTIQEWIECCAKACGFPATMIEYDCEAHGRTARDFFPFYDYDNVLDVQKIQSVYAEETDFIEGLRSAYTWYCEHKQEIVWKEHVEQNEHIILQELNQ